MVTTADPTGTYLAVMDADGELLVAVSNMSCTDNLTVRQLAGAATSSRTVTCSWWRATSRRRRPSGCSTALRAGSPSSSTRSASPRRRRWRLP